MNSLKVITAAGGQNSVTQMIGSLYDAIEDHYGIFASRLYRAFRPKPLKSTATSSWRKMCCLPYAYIYMVCILYDPTIKSSFSSLLQIHTYPVGLSELGLQRGHPLDFVRNKSKTFCFETPRITRREVT